jgi:hypothetical protein
MDINEVPRIRGTIGKVAEPSECEGMFCFEISIWDFSGTTRISEPIGPFGPFPSHEEAMIEMKKAIRIACHEAQKMHGCEVSEEYLDLKNGGMLRSWNEQ